MSPRRTARGKPFSGLATEDFTLLDNGVWRKIVSFAVSNQATDENERLTEVVLVLDEVNLAPFQFELVKSQSIEYLRQNGGHLAQPVSIYWFTTFGLYASAQPTTDGNLLADDVAHGRSHRVLWQLPPHREQHVTPESERYKQWDPALDQFTASLSSAETSRAGRFLVWMGFGWPARGPLERKDNAPFMGSWLVSSSTPFTSLVELSTRIREARMDDFHVDSLD